MFNPLPSPCKNRSSTTIELCREDPPFWSANRDYTARAQKMTLDSIFCSMSKTPWIPETKEKLADRLVHKKEYDPKRGLDKIGQEEASVVEIRRGLVARAVTQDGFKAFHELTLRDLLASQTCRAYEFLMTDFFEESWNRTTGEAGALELRNMLLEKLQGLHERQAAGEELIETPKEFPEPNEPMQEYQEVLEQPPQVQMQEEFQDFEGFPGIQSLENEFGGTVQEPMETDSNEHPERSQGKRKMIAQFENTDGPTGAQKVPRLQELKQELEDDDSWVPRPKRAKVQVDCSSDEEEEENDESVEPLEAHTGSGSQVPSSSSSAQGPQEDVPMDPKDLEEQQCQERRSTQPQQPPTIRIPNIKPQRAASKVPENILNLQLADENSVFTKNLCARISAEILAMNVKQGVFGKAVLNRADGTFSTFLKKPLAWNECKDARKEHHKTLLVWLGLCEKDKKNVINRVPTECCEFNDPQNVIINFQLPIDPPGTVYQQINNEQERKLKKAFETVVYPGKEHIDRLVDELGLDAPTIRRQFATMRNSIFPSNP